MLEAIRNRMRDRDEGFTLIELMVVVLIIAILVAIAIPTFLGARERAQEKAAQSDLRNALTAAKVIYTDTQDYSTVTATDLAGVEPSLSFVAVGSTTTDDVGFVGETTSGDTSVLFALEGGDGNFYGIAEHETAGTTSCKGGTLAEVQDYATCLADADKWA